MSVSYGGTRLITNWYVFLTHASDAKEQALMSTKAYPDASPAHDALAAILFSAVAAEAFINELADAARLDGLLPDQIYVSASVLRDLGNVIGQVERERGSALLKYDLAKRILNGSTFDHGTPPFQEFADLIALRNVLAHPRSLDKFTENGHIEPIPKIIRNLQQRGLTRTKGKNGDMPGGASWLYEIESSGVAVWAYGAAHNIIKAILVLLPDEQAGHVSLGFKSRLATM